MAQIIVVDKLPDDLRLLSWVCPDLAVGTLKQAQSDLPGLEKVDLLVCVRDSEPKPARAYRDRTRYFPLVDLVAALPDYFAEPTALIANAWQRGQRVFVYCAAGQSRSVTVAAVALVRAERAANFDEAVDLIAKARPRAAPAPALGESARSYLRGGVDWETFWANQMPIGE